MAFYQLSAGQDWRIDLEYRSNNLRLDSLYCFNQSSYRLSGYVILDGGQRIEQEFPVGETRVNLPGSMMMGSITLADGEVVFGPLGIYEWGCAVNYSGQ